MGISDGVMIVIPIYQKKLSGFEEISLRQTAKVLRHHPFTFVTYDSVDTHSHDKILVEYGIKTRRILFDLKFFNSISGYNRLLTSLHFYKNFKSYRYVLIVQLDVFVFADELADWCRKDYDYVGAPWLEGMNDAEHDASYVGVGNGGFSLRKVESALRILRSLSYIQRPGDVIRRFFQNPETGFVKRFGRLVRDLSIANNTFLFFNNYSGYEDHFWGSIAQRNFKWYRVPEPEEAVRFSMEVQPRSLYKRNGDKLPFGCHAWWRYDLEFWRPFLEKEGHILPISDQ